VGGQHHRTRGSASPEYPIIKHLKKNVTNYVFIDEVQNVPEFEKLLEGLYVHPNIDLYVTGSNAFLLSSELATLLTGRAYEINVLPFSFAEYLEFTGKTTNPDRAFAEYVRTGGFPEAVRLSADGNHFANEYLQTVFGGFRFSQRITWKRIGKRCRTFT
jgi:hypothetical protein